MREGLIMLRSQFEAGRAEIRAVCFDALISWPGYEVLYPLYTYSQNFIGEQTYQSKAFDSYIKLVAGHHCLMNRTNVYRKIFPWALSNEDKNKIVARLATVRDGHQSWLEKYLDDAGTAQVAARSIMNIALPRGLTTAGL
ncbi:MAG: hypothetical protein R2744_02510 [Bacteroidales bacterium]